VGSTQPPLAALGGAGTAAPPQSLDFGDRAPSAPEASGEQRAAAQSVAGLSAPTAVATDEHPPPGPGSLDMGSALLTDAQLTQFEQDGAVTLDTPLPPAAIAAASAALSDYLPRPKEGTATRAGRTCDYFDARLLDIIADPWLEEVAKMVLSAQSVTFFQTAIIQAWPDAQAREAEDTTDLQTLEGYHSDMQYNVADFVASPRRVQVSFFLWLSDVPLRRANLLVRPGSHTQLAQLWGDRTSTPRIEGIRQSTLPPDWQAAMAAAVPVVARAGQVTVLTTGTLHSASPNFDDAPRQLLVITFTPSCVEVGLPAPQAMAKRKYDAELHRRLPPHRVHIVAGDADSVTGWYGKAYYSTSTWIDETPIARM
jgi:hypothetical protein